MSVQLSTTATVALVDTSNNPGTILLPFARQIPYRQLVIKDRSGAFSRKALTLQTQTGDVFEDGTTTKIVRDPFGQIEIYSDGTNKWLILSGTQQIQATISSIITSSIIGVVTPANLISTTQSQGSTITLSTGTVTASTLSLFSGSGFQALNVSSGSLRLGSNFVFGGPSQHANIQTLDSQRANISTLYAGTLFGDGSRLSNLILPSTNVLQAQYSFFTVSSGTSYTGGPWANQLVELSTLNTQSAPVYLDTDGITLRVSSPTRQVYRISYMTGGNDENLSVVKPTLTMSVSGPGGRVLYPSVEAFEGGGGSVTFLETLDNSSAISFFIRGLSNYTFTNADANLYRVSFEALAGVSASVFSTVNVWTNMNRFTSSLQLDGGFVAGGQATVQSLVANNTSIFYSNMTVFGNTTLANNTNVTGNLTVSFSTISAQARFQTLQSGSLSVGVFFA